jgi:hypothetical protein
MRLELVDDIPCHTLSEFGELAPRLVSAGRRFSVGYLERDPIRGSIKANLSYRTRLALGCWNDRAWLFALVSLFVKPLETCRERPHHVTGGRCMYWTVFDLFHDAVEEFGFLVFVRYATL